MLSTEGLAEDCSEVRETAGMFQVNVPPTGWQGCAGSLHSLRKLQQISDARRQLPIGILW
jgi:hypothetical protein